MNLWLGEGPGRPPQRRSLSAGVIAGYFGSGAQGHPNKGYQLLPGFYAKSSTLTDAFLRLHSGRFITLAVPGASMTQAFGVNDRDEVVGAYTVGTGSSAVMHGFTWRPGHGLAPWTTRTASAPPPSTA